MEATSSARSTIRFGAFTLDLRTGELHKHGVRLKLQDQPFQILALLTEHPGEVVTREELQQKLWPQHTFVDFGTGLNSAVKKLRDVLNDSAEQPRYIETLPRRGYRFIAPVENGQSPSPLPVEQAPAAPPPLLDSQFDSQNVVTQVAPRKFWRWALSAVGILAVASTLAYVAVRGRSLSTAQAKINSIAVLPLKNLSGDPSQDYLADGMTEELIGRLSNIRNLRVISRTSVMRYKETQLSVPEIARTLHTDAVVEGSVIREGTRIRVHAQLIRAATDEHFWSETYDRELRDVLALEGDVAQSIAAKVQVTLTGDERARLISSRQISPEVYENFLKGLSISEYSPAGVEKSIAYFQQAIADDPTFAPAYVALAGAYGELGTPGIGVAPPAEERPKMIRAIQKALELDPTLPEAHAIQAEIYREEWQWSDAEREYKRLLDLNPNGAGAHLAFSGWLLCQGRAKEALAWARRARELDPFGIGGDYIGWVLFHAHQYDEAIHELQSAVAVHPESASVKWFLGFALIANGEAEKAIPVLEKAVSISERSPAIIGVLIRAYAHAGRRADALQLLAELKRRNRSGYVPTAAFVNAYLGLGDNEQAFVWLERAYREKSTMMQLLKVHPYFDPIRDDPRFKDLLRRVGLA